MVHPRPVRLIECPVAVRARRMPDASAVIAGDEVVTYGILDGWIEGVAAVLRARGVNPGDRLALTGREDAAFIVRFWAALRCGGIVAVMSPRLPPAALHERLEALNAVDISDTPLSPAEPGELPVFDLDGPAVALYTSGSTGRPKAALLTLGNLYYSALGALENMPLCAGDRWLLSLPIHHVSGIGILFRVFLAGAAVVVMEPDETIDETLVQHGVTHLSLVPTQLTRLLATGVPGRLRAVLLGGAPISDSLIDQALAAGWPLHTTYGLTEMASQVTATPQGADAATLRTAGFVLPHRSLRLGEGNEIQVRGETLFAGYLTQEGVQAPVDEQGWYPTGDLGMLDERGRLRVLGRKDNLFISGGENIQPEEIEEALAQCPGVVRSVVVPVGDVVYGARPFAFLDCDAAFAGEAALRSFLESRLPRFKIPMAFAPWPADAPTGLKPLRKWFEERADSIVNDR
jgi:o-succinylbenzoate---CoA ligase